MYNNILKTLILIIAIIGVILLYNISDKLEGNRYQTVVGSNKIIDSKTGEIYFYSTSRGHYKYVNGNKVFIKSLPK